MIREAIEFDIPRLIPLAEQYREEVQTYQNFEFDLKTAVINVGSCLGACGALVLVAVEKDEIVGFFWAVAQQLPWTSSLLTIDCIHFVTPKARGKAHGVRMYHKYEEWARGLGAKEAQLSVASGIETERTCKLYERMGYKCIGRSYRKEL